MRTGLVDSRYDDLVKVIGNLTGVEIVLRPSFKKAIFRFEDGTDLRDTPVQVFIFRDDSIN